MTVATGGYCPAIGANCSHWNKHRNICALRRNYSQNGNEYYCRNAGAGVTTIKNIGIYWKITEG